MLLSSYVNGQIYATSCRGSALQGILKTAEENLQWLSQYREEHAQVAELTRRTWSPSSHRVFHHCKRRLWLYQFWSLLRMIRNSWSSETHMFHHFDVRLQFLSVAFLPLGPFQGERSYRRKFLEISSWAKLPIFVKGLVLMTSGTGAHFALSQLHMAPGNDFVKQVLTWS